MSRRGRLLASFAFLALVPLLALPLVSRTPILGLCTAVFTVAVSAALGGIIMVRLRAGTFDLFEPVIFLPGYLLVIFGLATIPFILPLQPSSVSQVYPFWVNGLQPGTIAVVELVAAAATLLFMGAYLSSAKWLPLGTRVPSMLLGQRRLNLPRLALVFAVGLAAKLYLLRSGYIVGAGNAFIPVNSGYLEWVQLASQMTLYAMVLLALYILRNRPKDRRLWYLLWGMLAVNVLTGAAYGSKQVLLEGIEVLIVAWWYSRRRLPPQLLAGLVLVAMVAFVVIPAYRQNVGQGAGTSTGSCTSGSCQFGTASVNPISALTSATGSIFLGKSIPDLLATDAWSISRRLALAPDFGLAYQYTPSLGNPYLLGRDYLWALPEAFIPRAIWPNKPSPVNGLYFSIHYAGLPTNTTSSTSITWLGDLYMNFGLVGTLLGMCAMGVFFAWWYATFRRNFSMQTILIYAAAIPVIMNFEPTVPAVLTGLMRDLIILLAMLWFTFPPAIEESTSVRSRLAMSRRRMAGLLEANR
ncbi:MAG TPA: hypothetical protein VFB34_09950 [Chloroflexota bacterium]|nr:hypothetical protein [Chloroflexota bacterium]